MEKLILEINFDANLICTIKKYGFFYLSFLFVPRKRMRSREYGNMPKRNDRDSLRFLQYRRRAFTYSQSVHKPSLSLDKEPCLSHILPLLSTLTRHHRSSSDARSLLLRTSFSVLLKFIRYTVDTYHHIYIRTSICSTL